MVGGGADFTGEGGAWASLVRGDAMHLRVRRDVESGQARGFEGIRNGFEVSEVLNLLFKLCSQAGIRGSQ